MSDRRSNKQLHNRQVTFCFSISSKVYVLDRVLFIRWCTSFMGWLAQLFLQGNAADWYLTEPSLDRAEGALALPPPPPPPEIWDIRKENREGNRLSMYYRVSHGKVNKVIWLCWGYTFWFLLIFWVLWVHEKGTFMPNSSVFIFLVLSTVYGSISQYFYSSINLELFWLLGGLF